MIVNVNQHVFHSLLHFLQAAGKLVSYILSGEKHLVIEDCDMQNGVQDIVSQDLIDWMINNGPTIDEVLKHPYFWNPKM